MSTLRTKIERIRIKYDQTETFTRDQFLQGTLKIFLPANSSPSFQGS
mgnify:CR=1 FL=1